MFRSIFRFFRTIGYAMIGRIDAKTDKIGEDGHVIKAEYAEVIRSKNTQLIQIRDAVADLMSIQETKKDSAKKLTGEIERLEKLKAGAKARAAQLARGKSQEEAKADLEFQKCMAAFQNFSSTLVEKQEREQELEVDIVDAQRKIDGYKVSLTQLQRDLQKLREESKEAVVDMNLARTERETAEALAGIAQDNTAEQLSSLRGRIQRAKSQAKVTSELAGTDSALEEAAFLELAGNSETEAEFMDDIFGDDEADTPSEETTDQTPERTGDLPE